MSIYRDSVGNRYAKLPPRKPNPSAKPSSGGMRKFGRKCRKPSQIARRKRLGLKHVHEGRPGCKPR